MTEPRWNDLQLKAGTKVRAALWLVQEVGEGNIFTKEQLREAFPGVAQVDRRVRDLRDVGWVIDTNASDATLLPQEQRFATRGVDIWDPEERRAAVRIGQTVSNKQRQAVFAANDYQCVRCGVAGGESYPDRPSETAVLAISRRSLEREDGTHDVVLVTECKKCRAGDTNPTYTLSEVRSLIGDLDPDDLRRLMRWALRGVRGATAVDRAWNGLRSLPAREREKLLAELNSGQ